MHLKCLVGLLALAVAGCGGAEAPVSPALKAKGLSYAPSVAPADREWIDAALASARPEAHQLLDDVDGMVEIRTLNAPAARAVGTTQPLAKDRFIVTFNVGILDADRQIDRPQTVLHEFGHVIDFALVDPALRDKLAGELPSTGACFTPDTGDCTAPAERFADTFAKWSLRGAVSAVGAGYSVATPTSLEDWGAPLAALAIEVDVAVSGAP
jgi:hypothetical protein